MDEKLQACLDRLDFKPTEDQMNAFNTAIGKNHTLIVGRPGAGKSTLVQLLVDYLGDKLIIGSTTGISNQRLLDGKGGVGSMHRIFSLPTTLHTDTHKKKVSPFTREVLGKNQNLEYVLIDEAGFLLNSDYLELIQHRIKRFNKSARGRKRRDIKLILVGDFLQLPSFCNNDEKSYMQNFYGSEYFFKSYLFEQMGFKIANMVQVMRTDDNTFKAALDAMRYGEEQRYVRLCQWLNNVMYKRNIPKGLPVMSARNDVAEKANELALSQNPNPEFVYHTTVSGEYSIKNCPAGECVILKEGALVMTLVNDLENEEYQNGSIGEVTLATSDGVYILFKHTNKECFVGFNKFEQTKTIFGESETLPDGTVKQQTSSEVIGEAMALPVTLAYGLSVHKNQGASISSPCVVDLGEWGFNPNNSFGEALAYVSLSRFTSPELVYLKYPITPRHIKVNKEIRDWVLALEDKES